MASPGVGAGVTATIPLTLGRAWDVSERLLMSIGLACPELHALTRAGDLRRFEPLVSGIVLVGRADDAAAAIDAIEAQLEFEKISTRSATSIAGVYRQTSLEIRVATPKEFGSVLFAAT